MQAARFYLLSLGCAKNTVDSNSMAQLLGKAGLIHTPEPSEADVLIVNTCGFIEAARQESLEMLRTLAQDKRPDQVLIAAGCLTSRDRQLVTSQVPGVDGLLGTQRWMEIVRLVHVLRGANPLQTPYDLPESTPLEGEHVLRSARQGPSAYLKIADGCRRPCAFCSIPLIKGPAVSRPLEKILTETALLQDQGVRELILVAQDTSDYGSDLGLREGLAVLLERLCQRAPRIDWVRILYAYPGMVSDRLIEVMTGQQQILPYLDMPLQHAHPATLKRMRRPANMRWVYRTIEKMRQAMPDLALRTTFIVGYPGETEQEFKRLLDFVSEMRFDRVGAFEFSPEPGTASEPLGDPVPAALKAERRGRLMELQHAISTEKGRQFIGRNLQVLTEGQGDGLTFGRSYRDAPEIDGLVIVEGEHPIGEMLSVRIDGALPYDLTGKAVEPLAIPVVS